MFNSSKKAKFGYYMLKGEMMKKISSVISLSFLLLFLLVGCEKSSSDWVEYYRNPDGNVLLYQKVNIQKDKGNDIVKVCVKRVFSDVGRKKYIQSTKKIGVWTKELDKVSHIVGSYEIDCNTLMSRQLSVVINDTDGKRIGSISNGEPKWTSIVSGSEIGSLRKEVCK
jgi:hypothetical protein